MPHDDGAIADDAGLLRRIHPAHIIPDGNAAGALRLSSAAFKDPELSVDAEPILATAGLDWRFSLRGYPEHSLVRLQARAAREKGLAVVHKPLKGNDAHAEIIGKKTQSIANHLRDSSDWVFIRTP
jgi:hypothetical protein